MLETLPVEQEGTLLGDAEDQHRNPVIAELGLNLEVAGLVDDAAGAQARFPVLDAKPPASRKLELLDPMRVHLVHHEAAPAVLGQVPVVAGQLVADPLGDPRRAVE